MAKIEKKYTIPVNIAQIDSLSLKIPFLDCEIIDKRITSLTSTYYHDLDQYDQDLSPPKPIVITENGITVRILLISIPEYDKITCKINTVQYISLTVSTKLLKSNYFEGINKKNVIDIYNSFMAMEIFQCSYDHFLNSKVSDIDICINRKISSPVFFSDSLDVIMSQLGTRIKFARKISEVENIGLALNERRKATPSAPFVKFYHKYFELMTKSNEFYEFYLKENYSDQVQNLTRVEITVRNYSHRKRLEKYGILPDFKTFSDLLNISQKDLFNTVLFSLNAYVENKPRVTNDTFSPSDFILFEMMQNQYNAGYDLSSLVVIADKYKSKMKASENVARSRIRSKIREIDNIILNSSPDHEFIKNLKKNEIVNEYLSIFKFRKP